MSIRKAIEWPERAGTVSLNGSRMATRLSGAVTPDVLDEILKLNLDASGSRAALGGEWLAKDSRCAHAFDFELSDSLAENVQRLKQAVCEAIGVNACCILVFDEQTGFYISLDDLRVPGGTLQEMPNPDEEALQALLGTNQPVLKAHLSGQHALAGLVAVAEKSDSTALNPRDQVLLEVMSPYLARKVEQFMRLRQSQSVPFVQGVVLELAGKLVTAVDRDAIITAVLETFVSRLGFDACQYVGFSPETGIGEVLYDARNTNGQLKFNSYSHAGLEGKRRKIKEFANLVGLLSSMARNRFYLHLNGKKLGDRTLGDIFGIRNIQSALLLPVVDLATGEIRGTFNLFLTSDALIGEASRQVAQEAVQLVSQALSRAMVLEKALAMASSDELTGLINRRGYYQRFEAEVERARRHQTPLCVALVDVDHFKKFNDTYGHLSGDRILKALAGLFVQNLRRSDVVCRFGGEEFAILLPDTSLKSAVELMVRVRQNVESLAVTGINGETLRATISVGVAEVNTKPKAGAHRSEISEALSIADEKLYEAKGNGRNQVCYAQPGCDEAGTIPQAG